MGTKSEISPGGNASERNVESSGPKSGDWPDVPNEKGGVEDTSEPGAGSRLSQMQHADDSEGGPVQERGSDRGGDVEQRGLPEGREGTTTNETTNYCRRRTAHPIRAVKSAVKADVSSEVAAEAHRVPADGIRPVAEGLRASAVDEITETHRDVERGRVAARVSQIIDYLFFLVYSLLGIRLLLELFGAREGVAFFRFIKTVTDPIYWPFKGLTPSPSTADGFTLELPILVALFVYALLPIGHKRSAENGCTSKGQRLRMPSFGTVNTLPANCFKRASASGSLRLEILVQV